MGGIITHTYQNTTLKLEKNMQYVLNFESSRGSPTETKGNKSLQGLYLLSETESLSVHNNQYL